MMALDHNSFAEKIRSSSLIMLIDEEKKLLDAISEYLQSQGFRVVTAHSTEIALKKLNNLRPDIFVLDSTIIHKTKISFLQELEKNSNFHNIPFIFLTTKGMTKDRIQGYKLGCSAYITKPFDPYELLAIIENILIKHKNVKEIFRITAKIKQIRIEIEKQYYLTKSLCLTPREKTVVAGVISGLSNLEIAFKCQTSRRNIEKYVTRLLQKTNTKNRTELTKFMYGVPRYNYIQKADDGNRTRE